MPEQIVTTSTVDALTNMVQQLRTASSKCGERTIARSLTAQEYIFAAVAEQAPAWQCPAF